MRDSEKWPSITASRPRRNPLKAFLTFHQEPFRKTHNIQELGEDCLELKPDLPASVRAAFGLTQYTWIFRYPGGPREIEGEPQEALGLAQRLYENLVAILPGQARP